jgi:hypothetical protein
VAAPFAPGATPRYQLVGVGSQTFGKLDSFKQEAGGGVSKIGDTLLSGQSVIQNISGDASFALGRWVAGTVTKSSGAETLTGNDNRSYHYVLYNALASFPASGSFSCDGGVFSAPTRDTGSASAPNTGASSGDATLSFGASGASVSGKVAVSAGGVSGTAALNATVSSPSSGPITGSYLSGGSGASVQVADAGSGAYQVVGSYRAVLSSGAGYIGVYRFLCK